MNRKRLKHFILILLIAVFVIGIREYYAYRKLLHCFRQMEKGNYEEGEKDLLELLENKYLFLDYFAAPFFNKPDKVPPLSPSEIKEIQREISYSRIVCKEMLEAAWHSLKAKQQEYLSLTKQYKEKNNQHHSEIRYVFSKIERTFLKMESEMNDLEKTYKRLESRQVIEKWKQMRQRNNIKLKLIEIYSEKFSRIKWELILEAAKRQEANQNYGRALNTYRSALDEIKKYIKIKPIQQREKLYERLVSIENIIKKLEQLPKDKK